MLNKLQLSLTALAATAAFGITTIAPAYADGAASTRTIIGAAAVLAGIAIESNVARKRANANEITGYLSDGSPVYNDGHIVARDGQTYYPGDNGQSVACDNGSCRLDRNDANGNRDYRNNDSRYNNNRANDNRANDSRANDNRNSDYRNNDSRYNDRNR